MISTDFNRLRGAIVGFGSIGHRHAVNLAGLGVEQLTVVRRADGCNAAFQVPSGVRVVHSISEAIAGGVDFAIIANPTSYHVDAASAFLEAGIAVLVEKPISDNSADARKLVQLAADRKVPGYMAYCMRYHPAYRQAAELLGSNAVGQLRYAKAWFESCLPDWHPWEDYRQSYAARQDLGGGALKTLDHEIDFLHWTLGSAKDACGFATRTGGLETTAADCASLVIRYENNITANLNLSFCRRDRSRGFEFVGDEGTLSYCWNAQQLRMLRGLDQDEQLVLDHRDYDVNQMYVDLVAGFLQRLVGGESAPGLPGLEDGLRSIELCERVVQADQPKHIYPLG